MRCRVFTVCVFLVVMLALNGCAAPTAAPTSTVPPTTAPIAATVTTAPTAIPATTVPTAVPPTAAPSATRTSAPPTSAPTATTQPTSSAAQSKSSSSASGTAKLDLNVLVPPGDGRELIIENCMACHSIAPILVSQKTAGEWNGTSVNHRTNLAAINDADYKKMFDYLAKNFGPDHKIPDLPPELLAGWTNY